MPLRKTFSLIIRMIAILLILAAAGLGAGQYRAYRLLPFTYPPGTTIAGLAVGGLDPEQAQRLIDTTYSLPVELHYQGTTFQATPEELGFRLDMPAMLEQAGTEQAVSFWDFLWQRTLPPEQVELIASQDQPRLRAYLQAQVAARYDLAPVPAQPVLGSLDFSPSQAGSALQVEEAARQIEAALRSPLERSVELTSSLLPAAPMGMDSLQRALLQVLKMDGFAGLAEISAVNIASGDQLDLTVHNQELLPTPVAFTAASTIKIPVMISVFRRLSEPATEADLQLVRNMIEASDNPSTDLIVQTAIDHERGPLEVTADLQALGYQNTFWAGYFYDGAPLLEMFDTPANRSPAYNVHPDIYNQTTSADMADLLAEIDRCAKAGSGKLIDTFAGEISQAECGQMVAILQGNWLPVLIKAGLPEGTPAGHKHGWISGPDDLVHTFSDVALVESPGATYALAIYLYSDEQLLFDPANLLFAGLSRVAYNFFNP